jgi:plasmid stabilization system protein ParE
MAYHVHITDKALAEIDETLGWYAERSMAAAVRWYIKLKEAIRSLEDNPEQWGLAAESEWYPCELHEMLYGKKRGMYRVLFEIRGDTVYILRVRHGSRDFLAPGEID